MAVVIALGIAVVAVAFIAAPFFLVSGRPAGGQASGAGEPERAEALRDLQAEKETIFAAIQELDFDFKSGKLSAEDHEALRVRHEAQAAALLQRIDELEGVATAGQSRRAARETRRA
jgi:uncharacterized protein involved in type VI secretion and phage assembly